MKLKNIKKILSIGVLLMGSSLAHASLSTSYTFVGNGNSSVDACGSNATDPTCTVSAVIPTGSTIVAAFMYSTMHTASTVPTVSLDGVSYSGGDWTALGLANSYLQAYRTDVTAQIAAAVGGGSAVPYTFTVNNESPNNSIDGEVLAIIYSNPNETERTIAFLDGFSATTGDTTTVNLADPLTDAQLADADFEATLSLGIGYGYQATSNFQSSTVDVNGANLTTCAGGEDDGISSNGGLITVGGLGDSTANDHDCTTANGDDEYYTLTPFLAAGDTSITIDTLNPSNDDNIFFAEVNITARAGVNEPPPPPVNSVSEAGTIALFGLGLLGLGLNRKKIA